MIATTDTHVAIDSTGLRIAHGSWTFCAAVARLPKAAHPVVVRAVTEQELAFAHTVESAEDEGEDACSEAAWERRIDAQATLAAMGEPEWAQ